MATWKTVVVAWFGGACAIASPVVGRTSPGQPVSSAAANSSVESRRITAERMLEAGPEAKHLASLVGVWDVTMTTRPKPDAVPVVVRGIVAERSVVGLYLTETMKPSSPTMPDFRRIDYLTYDKAQTRWEYTSMDTRAPIGIMFAKSYANSPGYDITVYFDTFPNPGLGEVGGAVRARHVDSRENDDHTFKRQYWTVPGEPEWLAIEYDYRRHR